LNADIDVKHIVLVSLNQCARMLAVDKSGIPLITIGCDVGVDDVELIVNIGSQRRERSESCESQESQETRHRLKGMRHEMEECPAYIP